MHSDSTYSTFRRGWYLKGATGLGAVGAGSTRWAGGRRAHWHDVARERPDVARQRRERRAAAAAPVPRPRWQAGYRRCACAASSQDGLRGADSHAGQVPAVSTLEDCSAPSRGLGRPARPVELDLHPYTHFMKAGLTMGTVCSGSRVLVDPAQRATTRPSPSLWPWGQCGRME
jgi:hypothetical protein